MKVDNCLTLVDNGKPFGGDVSDLLPLLSSVLLLVLIHGSSPRTYLLATTFGARSEHGSERWEAKFERCRVAHRELDLIERSNNPIRVP